MRGPATIQVFRDPELGVRITDVNTRFGGAFPAPALAALPGRSYPELIVRMAAGEHVPRTWANIAATSPSRATTGSWSWTSGCGPRDKDILPAG